MAVAEDGGAKIGSSTDNGVVSSPDSSEVEKSKPSSVNGDQNLNNGVFNHQHQVSVPNGSYGYKAQMHGNGVQNQQLVMNNVGYWNEDHGEESFKRDMRDLEELLSKLNPMVEEFVPPSLTNSHGFLAGAAAGFSYPNNFILLNNFANANGKTNRRRKNGYNQGKRRTNYKIDMEKREEMIRRTVYVSNIDQLVVDCRVCGDPNSILRFAFIEFTDEESARAALTLSGTMLGYYPLRVLPSKTAIALVNLTYLPRWCYISQSEDEREMCSRTIYCTNIDKKLTQADVKHFFESICGEAESAIAALSCSRVILGSLPIRVSPSKTPVRSRVPRSPMH